MISKYNEEELARHILEHGFTSKMRFYELNVIARYLYSLGKSKDEILTDLIKFCERYFENFNYVKYRIQLQRIIKNCSKYKLFQIGSLEITRGDLKCCNIVQSFEENKLLFTLLCLYKINMKRNNNKFINKKYTAITKMAHITTTKKMMKLLKSLHEEGFIRVCINGSIEWLYNIDDTDDEIVFYVNDIDNCGLYYVNYIRGGYKECENCGKMIQKISNNKYCDSCKKIVKNEQNKKYYYKKQ